MCVTTLTAKNLKDQIEFTMGASPKPRERTRGSGAGFGFFLFSVTCWFGFFLQERDQVGEGTRIFFYGVPVWFPRVLMSLSSFPGSLVGQSCPYASLSSRF